MKSLDLNWHNGESQLATQHSDSSMFMNMSPFNERQTKFPQGCPCAKLPQEGCVTLPWISRKHLPSFTHVVVPWGKRNTQSLQRLLDGLTSNSNLGRSYMSVWPVVRVGTYKSQLPTWDRVEKPEILYYNVKKECKSQSSSHSRLSGSVNSSMFNCAVSECKSYINQQEVYLL